MECIATSTRYFSTTVKLCIGRVYSFYAWLYSVGTLLSVTHPSSPPDARALGVTSIKHTSLWQHGVTNVVLIQSLPSVWLQGLDIVWLCRQIMHTTSNHHTLDDKIRISMKITIITYVRRGIWPLLRYLMYGSPWTRPSYGVILVSIGT